MFRGFGCRVVGLGFRSGGSSFSGLGVIGLKGFGLRV